MSSTHARTSARIWPRNRSGPCRCHRESRATLTVHPGLRLPFLVVGDCVHEIVGNSDTVIGVLEEDRAVSLTVNAPVVSRVDERPGLLLLVRLRPDELDNVGVIGVEYDHLGRPPRSPTRFYDAGERIVAFHEGDGSTGLPAGREVFLGRPETGQVRAGS